MKTRIFLLLLFFSPRCSLKYSSETEYLQSSAISVLWQNTYSSLRRKSIADTKKQSYKQINATLRGGSVAGYIPPFCFLKYITENNQNIC